MGLTLSMAFPIVLLTWLLPTQRASSYDMREKAIRHIVEAASGILQHYGQLAASGAMPVPEAQASAKEALRRVRFDNGNYVWINDPRPFMVMHPTKPELEGKDLADNRDPNGVAIFVEMARVSKERGEGLVRYMWPKPGQPEPSPKISYVKLYPQWGWIVGAGVYVDDVESSLRHSRNLILLFTFLDLVASIVFCYLATRSIVTPIRRATADLNQVANETRSAADQVASAAQEIACRTSEQAATVEETSASLQQLDSYGQRSKTSAQNIRRLVDEVSTVLREGDRQMTDMNGAIEEIQSSAKDVGKIIKSIEEIAFQTNILALNAAVEAARAGEAGAGFSVVADEVRNLAQRASKAAQETAALISRSLASSEKGHTNSSKLTVAIGGIVTKIAEVNEALSEITASMESQTEGISQINQAVGQLNEVTQSQAASSEETASAAQQLHAQAESMRSLSGTLHQVVEGAESRQLGIAI